MKNFIFTMIYVLYSSFAFSQASTSIQINIPQKDTTELKATIFIENPMLPLESKSYRDTVLIKNGKCRFSFDLKNTSYVYLIINNKYVTFPGDYAVLVEPNDNLVFDLPSFQDVGFFGWGITKIKISGKGSEKLKLVQRCFFKLFEIYKSDPEFHLQSLTYQYKTTDKKLSAIDSILAKNNTVPNNNKDLLKAQLYSLVMGPTFRSSKRSDSDSVRTLFNKYIISKNRMHIFFKKNMVKYGGMIGSYLILSEFKNPYNVGGDDFEIVNRLEYAKILEKNLIKYPEIKDFLLSKHVIAAIKSGFDSTTTNLYKFYSENADFNNPNYSTIVKLYEETEKKLAQGKPFYEFTLPDSTGTLHNLKDFRGKVLVIDFWYNGCGGCKLMVPALESIEKKMHGRNLQFISIGIDKKKLWLDGIGKYSSINSLQLFTEGQSKDHPMMKYLNIYAYPRLIVVDKEGRITSAPPEPRSSTKEFVRFIENLL
ncbi:TlpA family protein disulfide reductase [Chryseobacterium indologenes]|uniref:TlpA family protein disulfide reductase n=1 Tax=Chryseobacterium indologenes TaxID=253 RepID=UPI003D325645